MYWRRVQKNSIIQAILVEFLEISLFHETKIPMVDMKVRVSSKFSKNKIWKKMKSPSSMRNGRFHTPKCRGKLQKMGVLYTHSSKMLGPSPNNQKWKMKKLKKLEKGGPAHSLSNCRLRSGRPPAIAQASFFMCMPPPFPSSYLHFFLHVVNSSSLTTAHAHPTQTSKIFKHA
jgi:hypothetical protein